MQCNLEICILLSIRCCRYLWPFRSLGIIQLSCLKRPISSYVPPTPRDRWRPTLTPVLFYLAFFAVRDCDLSPGVALKLLKPNQLGQCGRFQMTVLFVQGELPNPRSQLGDKQDTLWDTFSQQNLYNFKNRGKCNIYSLLFRDSLKFEIFFVEQRKNSNKQLLTSAEVTGKIGNTGRWTLNKMFWVRSLRPIYSILCGDLTATMSQNSTADYL